jgi:uncharacterized protein YecT (DUF1311 family)
MVNRKFASIAAAAVLALAAFVVPQVARVAHAEVAAADPIDAAMRACLARGDMSSTAGQVQCMNTARTAWQAALDMAYQQVLAKSSGVQHRRWETSEKRWTQWRDAEAKMQRAVFETTHGTMYVLFEADMQLQPVRDRALALRRAAVREGSGDPLPRLRACSADAQCEHAMFDLNRYYRRLNARMPPGARSTLVQAQRAWVAFRDATTPVIDAHSRIDIIGARIATLKRLSETVGND